MATFREMDCHPLLLLHCWHPLICFPVSYMLCPVGDEGQVLRQLRLSWPACPTLRLRRKPGYLCLFVFFLKHELVACCSATGYAFKIRAVQWVTVQIDRCSLLTSDPGRSKATKLERQHPGENKFLENFQNFLCLIESDILRIVIFLKANQPSLPK